MASTSNGSKISMDWLSKNQRTAALLLIPNLILALIPGAAAIYLMRNLFESTAWINPAALIYLAVIAVITPSLDNRRFYKRLAKDKKTAADQIDSAVRNKYGVSLISPIDFDFSNPEGVAVSSAPHSAFNRNFEEIDVVVSLTPDKKDVVVRELVSL